MSKAASQIPPLAAWHRLRIILEMIKFEHTVFALPFALMAAVLAAQGLPPWRATFWILVAMVGARSSAMAFNRLVDLEFDRRNPRTATRALPAGQLTPAQVWLLVAAATAVFFVAAAMLNPLSLALSPVALAVIWGYSLTKRFTSLCHLVLGIAIGIAPSAAWIAVRGSLAWAPVLLTAAVVLWVGGFDIIYACQDVEFDRGAGLRSLPVRLGIGRALLVSRLMHAVTVALLLALPWMVPLGVLYYAGVALAAALLAYEHSLVKPHDLSRINAAFFTVNGWVSLGLFAFTAADVLLLGHG
ncbi:MAG TPA: UbiA-like polyprenyltransferase [Armatimonadota bacterium]|nr:UbiA-like polyprenyltransferase [Armatimonadota bacterium]